MPPERHTEWTRHDWLGHLRWDTDGQRWWITDLETNEEFAFEDGKAAVRWAMERSKARYPKYKAERN